ncbi:MAG: PilX N-terminal domain-containing pilus assembly protein [Pseudomonadota bacterium]|nr:PilX N-terminal domain-containing pilus assembly protein [Pseudomonadota bacterium]
MSPRINRHRQQGATLIISLVMLVMVTLLVVGTMSLSLTNLKVAGNMQYRSEAMAAANLAMEQVIGADFTINPQAQVITVDISRDNVTDYTVNIAQPTCIKIRVLNNSELTLPADLACVAGIGMGIGAQSLCAETRWEVIATVQDANSGGVVTLRQGVSKRMESTLAQSQCG